MSTGFIPRGILKDEEEDHPSSPPLPKTDFRRLITIRPKDKE